MQFKTSPNDSKIKALSKTTTKLTFATLMQLKFGHGYFRSYLKRLPNYDSGRCTGRCVGNQTPEHLILQCDHYKHETLNMQRNIGQPINMQMLMTTKIGLENLIKFLNLTKLATRKWILGQDLDTEPQDEGGWGEIDH